MDVYGAPGSTWPVWARNTRKSLDAHHITVTRLLEEVYGLVKANKREDIMQAMIDVGRSDLFQLHTFVQSLGTEFYIGEDAERITKMAKEEQEAIQSGIYNLYMYGSHGWVTIREEDYLYINIVPDISKMSHSCLCGKCGRQNFLGLPTPGAQETQIQLQLTIGDTSQSEENTETAQPQPNIDYDEHPPFQFSSATDLHDIPWFDENSTLDDIAEALELMDIDEDEYEDVEVTMSLEDYYSAVQLITSEEEKETDCCICLEKCSEDASNPWRNIIVKTACGHVYHNMCIQRLCCETGPPKCPICRHDIREKLMIEDNRKPKDEKEKED